MNSALLREGMILSQSAWEERLGTNAIVISDLQNDSILRKSANSNGLRLDYVGLLSTKKAAFFSVPKIFPIDFDISDLSRVVASIQTYQRAGQSSSVSKAGDGQLFDEGGKLVDHFLGLLEWTDQFGLHQDENQISSSEFEHIDWTSTLRSSLATHLKKGVVYIDPVGRRSALQHSPLALIQARALLSLADELSPILPIWIDPFHPVLEECRDLIAETEIEFSAQDVLTYLRDVEDQTSRDADLDLISLLKGWLQDNFLKPVSVRKYGTNAFHTIWEAAISSFLSSKNDAAEHAFLASQPSYEIAGQRDSAINQIPDFVKFNENEVWLADAKWYSVESSHLPRLHDIVKQLMYELTIHPSYKVQANSFVVPHFGAPEIKNLGFATMYNEQGHDDRFPRISIISLDWRSVIDAFRSGESQERWADVLSHTQL